MTSQLVGPYLLVATIGFASVADAMRLGRGDGRTIGYVFVGAAGAILTLTLFNGLNMAWFLKRAKSAIGTLESFEQSSIRNFEYLDPQVSEPGQPDRDAKIRFKTAHYRFVDDSGQPHTFTADVSRGQADTAGDKVRIHYLPQEPSVARRAQFMHLWRYQVLGAFLGLLFGTIGVIAMFVVW